jgi:hypothetical protein
MQYSFEKNQSVAHEILVNANLVNKDNIEYNYDFLLAPNHAGSGFEVADCIRLYNFHQQDQSLKYTLYDCLFELQHVRIDPLANNENIIALLLAELYGVGVEVQQDTVTINGKTKHLGKIHSAVRFHLKPNSEGNPQVIFLAPTCKLKLVGY